MVRFLNVQGFCFWPHMDLLVAVFIFDSSRLLPVTLLLLFEAGRKKKERLFHSLVSI